MKAENMDIRPAAEMTRDRSGHGSYKLIVSTPDEKPNHNQIGR